MPVDFFQAAVLAFIQGFTEFLPISSSGHLLLPTLLLGWPDQGLAFDVAVHLGSLVAVITYFRHDLWRLCCAWLANPGVIMNLNRESGEQGEQEDARLAWYLILATLPAAAAGLLVNDLISGMARSLWVVGTTSIVFGGLLYYAEWRGTDQRSLTETNLKAALWIGLAQMLALIPGTSRAGITMTAALLCNFSKQAAARFSFLLAIPIIAASGLFTTLDLLSEASQIVNWWLLLYAALLSGLVAFACIHFFLTLISRVGFLPFVIYRLILGGCLLLLGFNNAN
ncbi:MAG: undecaprenyl-diphosphate phosphatase [Pseudohongiellaceae bacterium]